MIRDLEQRIVDGPQERRTETLRQVTDLFLRDAPVLSDEQIEVFDVLIARLATAIESRARAELSERLADVPNAPRGVIRSLAQDEIVVARPVLARSERLSDEDLVAVALAKGRDHMLAISERDVLTEPVTDVLVSRGDRVVVHAVAGNPGARFSEGSIAALLDRSRADAALQALLEQRVDLPEPHLRQLVEIAKETARRRLADSLPESARPAINGAVERSATRIEAAVVPGGRDYSEALATVQSLADKGALTEKDLVGFAAAGRLEEAVCAVAMLVGLSLPAAERLFGANEADLILVVAKAQGWAWSTVKALILLKGGAEGAARHLRRSLDTYESMSPTTAQRVLHFLKLREEAQRQAVEAAARRQIRSKVK